MATSVSNNTVSSNLSHTFCASSLVIVSGLMHIVTNLSSQLKWIDIAVTALNGSLGGANPFLGSKSTSISNNPMCNLGSGAFI